MRYIIAFLLLLVPFFAEATHQRGHLGLDFQPFAPAHPVYPSSPPPRYMPPRQPSINDHLMRPAERDSTGRPYPQQPTPWTPPRTGQGRPLLGDE